MRTSSESNQKAKTIMGCMSNIIAKICIMKRGHERAFNENIFTEWAEDIEYVCNMCGINPMQAVILSACIEHSHRRSYYKEELASDLGMSYITVLSYDEDLQSLAKKKMLLLRKNERIKLNEDLIEILAKNEKYVVPNNRVDGTQALMKAMKKALNEREDGEIEEDELMERVDALMEENEECSFVKRCTEYKILGKDKIGYMERLVFYNLVYSYLYEDDDAVGWHDFENIIEDDCDIHCLMRSFQNEQMELQKLGIIEPALEDGFKNADYFHIKDNVKEVIFEEVGGLKKKPQKVGRFKTIQCSDILPKQMFYNPTEESQLGRLSQLLKNDTYQATCRRLKESGLRTGFSCIFYGSPGTGKTESVYQIAKATGRALIPVNVSEVKSCWVGESEKLIKGIFDKYRAAVEDSEIAPILLFNEADAIFGIRKESATDAVDKMENSIQNIILQEMEKLNGILIATTNLTQNLDKAFERRFLYKVKFDKPSEEAKSKIWKSLIPDLTESQAAELAADFDFSGGQIENVSRKKMIQSIIDGVTPGFEEIRAFCSEENLVDKEGSGKRIGY